MGGNGMGMGMASGSNGGTGGQGHGHSSNQGIPYFQHPHPPLQHGQQGWQGPTTAQSSGSFSFSNMQQPGQQSLMNHTVKSSLISLTYMLMTSHPLLTPRPAHSPKSRHTATATLTGTLYRICPYLTPYLPCQLHYHLLPGPSALSHLLETLTMHPRTSPFGPSLPASK